MFLAWKKKLNSFNRIEQTQITTWQNEKKKTFLKSKHKKKTFQHRNRYISNTKNTSDRKNTILFFLTWIFELCRFVIAVFFYWKNQKISLKSFIWKRKKLCVNVKKWVRIHRISSCRSFILSFKYIYVVNFKICLNQLGIQ